MQSNFHKFQLLKYSKMYNKSTSLIFLLTCFILTAFNAKAQTISTFENLNLDTMDYWDGSDSPLGTTFTDGNALFHNYYDTSYGGFWSEGWAYSKEEDSITSFSIFSARPGMGYKSAKYLIGQQDAKIIVTGSGKGKKINGFFITNNTYTANALQDGDLFSKQFGGLTGNDPDFFKIKIQKYYNGVLTNDSVVFYLADYRDADNSKDYIVKNWRWVDLSTLGNVDSLVFHLTSSDNGQFGMNTPAFFCIDDFTTANYNAALTNIQRQSSISIYPNPANDIIYVAINTISSIKSNFEILDITGKVISFGILNPDTTQISVAELPSGIYYLKTVSDQFTANKMFIKQ